MVPHGGFFMLFNSRCPYIFPCCLTVLCVGFLAIFVFVADTVIFADDVTVLEFTSPQCAACRQVEPLVQQLVAKGYPIQQVDAATESQLAQQLGVEAMPSFAVLAHGQLVARIEGVFDGFALEKRLQLAIEKAQKTQPGQISSQTAAPMPLQLVSHVEPRPLVAPAMPLQEPMVRELQPVSQDTSTTKSPTEVPWLQATVRLRVENPNGHDWGTGTIIDARGGEVLILTCGHIFRDSKGQGKIEVDLYCGNTSKRVPGVCLRYDADRLDLGLVKIAPPFQVDVIPVAPPGLTLQENMTLISTGCDNGNNPTIRQHRVQSLTSSSPYVGAPFSYIKVDNAPVQGRSGGGLFTENGYLVGVCVAGNSDINEGFFVPASAIHNELDLARLSCVYQSPSVTSSQSSQITLASAVTPIQAEPLPKVAGMAQNTNFSTQNNVPQAVVISNPSVVQPVFVPQNEASAIMQPSFGENQNPVKANNIHPLAAAQPTGYTETTMTDREIATLQEVQRRQNDGDEVIIVVRSKRNPDEPCEVIQLSEVSQAFLNALTNPQ